MPMSDHEMVSLLKEQASSLYGRMLSFPDRPSWQIEYLSIMLQIVDVLNLLDSNLSSTSLNLTDLSVRVKNLENRYSEVLYKMADLK